MNKPLYLLNLIRSNFVVILATIFILLLDIFGFKSASNSISINTWNRYASVFYPPAKEELFIGKNEKTGVVTILINDDFIKLAKIPEDARHWPLPYAAQATLFNQILFYKPKAMYIDLNYQHMRDSEKEQFKKLKAYIERPRKHTNTKGNNDTIPIFLPAPLKLNADGTYTFNESSPTNQFNNVNTVLTAWEGYKDLYPLDVDMTYKKDNSDSSQSPTTDHYKPMETVAAAIYRTLKRSNEGDETAFKKSVISAPMVVNWGFYYYKEMEKLVKFNQEQCITNSKSSDFLSFLIYDSGLYKINLEKLLSIDLFGSHFPKPRERLPCPYITTIPAHYLLSFDFTKNEVIDPILKNDLQELIENNIVLIGTDIEGVGSRTTSPVHGQLPSVYWHATALHNLLHYKDDYITRNNILLAIIEIFVVILGIVLKELSINRSKAENIFTSICFMAFILTIVFVLTYLHLEPLNWVGLIAVSTIMMSESIATPTKKLSKLHKH